MANQGGKGKRKNDGPAELRYRGELRWVRNKERVIAKDKRIKAKIAASPKKKRAAANRQRKNVE